MKSSTPSIEGRQISAYHGIVVGEAIPDIIRDPFAGTTDIIRGRSGAYEPDSGNARSVALEEMQDRAGELAANAVRVVYLGYEAIKNTLMGSAFGMAVSLD